MDKLYEVADFYLKNLMSRKFHLTVGKSNNLLEFDIIFGAEDFKHLFGLHKLKDIIPSSERSSMVLQRILEGEYTYDKILKSNKFKKIEPRIENYKDIKEALFSKELFLKSLKGTFGQKIEATFTLAKQKGNKYSHIFFKESNKISMPITFIIQPNDFYLRGNIKYKILSIEEVTDQMKSKNENKEQSSASSEVAVTQEPANTKGSEKGKIQEKLSYGIYKKEGENIKAKILLNSNQAIAEFHAIRLKENESKWITEKNNNNGNVTLLKAWNYEQESLSKKAFEIRNKIYSNSNIDETTFIQRLEGKNISGYVDFLKEKLPSSPEKEEFIKTLQEIEKKEQTSIPIEVVNTKGSEELNNLKNLQEMGGSSDRQAFIQMLIEKEQKKSAQEPTTSTAEVKPNGADVPKKKDFVEIEPRQIYGEKDGKYLLKSDADSQGNKKQFLVPKQSVKLDKDGKVASVSANVQNHCKFTRKQAKNIKTRTK